MKWCIWFVVSSALDVSFSVLNFIPSNLHFTPSFELLFFYSTLSLPPDDCAGLLLACLHCRFHELMVLLPDTCERAVSRCFPSFKYITASSERDQQGKDCWGCRLELDCNFCSSCQDTAELIELAMEISEVCYRWQSPFLYLTSILQHYNQIPLLSWAANSDTYNVCNKYPAQPKVCVFFFFAFWCSHKEMCIVYRVCTSTGNYRHLLK